MNYHITGKFISIDTIRNITYMDILLEQPKGYFVADENPEAFEAYGATFPKKEKIRLPGLLGYEE